MPTPDENKAFLTDLFCGEFRGHAFAVTPPGIPSVPGDFTVGSGTVAERADLAEREYERWVRFQEAVGDDGVPYAITHTGTGIFANAFGCRIAEFEGSNPAAMPMLTTPAEADALRDPEIEATALGQHLELIEELVRRLGPETPIGGADMQSPLGIAAVVWEKAAFFEAMLETPDAVHGLIDRCCRLLERYLSAQRDLSPSLSPIHCPTVWGPKELGCSVSEDEVGAISRAMYEEFGLPQLIRLSERFGGIYIHCCAAADHQYEAFKKIPNLRGLNRNFQEPGALPCLRAFGDRTVHSIGWPQMDRVREFLDYDVPNVRYLFSYSASSMDDAKRAYETFRGWCERQ